MPETSESSPRPDRSELDLWADALRGVTERIAPGMGFGAVEVAPHQEPLGVESGATLALVGDSVQVQLELLGDREPLTCLARGLMMMEPDEPLDWEDAVDAVSEIVNVLAGGLKSDLIERIPSLRLGLPVFAEGIHPLPLARRAFRVVFAGHAVILGVALRSDP
jgi:hypothetical protein